MKRLISSFFLAATLAFVTQYAWAAFDPVNDDTDIFLANPNITAERPNVLIILDNTANWNNAFTNEKSALVSVVNGLDDRYNVGLMMFPETGGGNDSVDGGYVRFHVRQMSTTNKTALSSLVGALNQTSDKGNNGTTGLAMYEAYRYYGGLTSYASFGKVKTDYAGNATNNPFAAPLTDHALPASPNASSLYTSPVADGCQKNYIIYISNGPANENASARSALQGYLSALTGKSPPDTLSISPNGLQANWADELAQYMASADVNAATSGTQNVITYTLEIDPGSTGQAPDMTALLNSMANKGGGKYYATTSGNSGVGITDALNKIFAQVQAVNSVFAATTLPVSVNVRGTNLNQVYVGMFRPDATKQPRWFGNLKAYKLGLNTTDNSLFLVDSNGAAAEDTNTHFVINTATSFWTSGTLTPTNFWSFRDSSLNGVGGSSDAADGNLVEKGGAAQQLRHYYQSSQSSRNLYSCTTGGNLPDCVACTASGSGSNKTCANGSALSATPFNTTNSAISATALNLSTQPVSTLTAKRSVTLTTLTDRKTATLSNHLASGSSATATTISSGSASTTRTVSSLTTAAPVTVGNVTVGTTATTTNGNLTWTLVLSHASGNTFSWNVKTGAAPAAPSSGTYSSGPTITSALSGATVLISGSTGTCTGIGPTSINISSAVAAGTAANTASGAVTGSTRFNGAATCTVTLTAQLASTFVSSAGTSGSTATVTTSTPHGYLSGQSVTTSLSNSLYNCTSAGITVVSATSFSCSLATAQFSSGSPAITGTVSASSQIITVTTTTPHGYIAGNSVTIVGASPTGYNGTYTVLTNTRSVASVGQNSTTNFSNVTGWPTLVTGSSTFTLLKQTNSTASLLAVNSASPVYTVAGISSSISQLTLSFASNPFNTGDIITISGSPVTSYNRICAVNSGGTSTSLTCSFSPSITGPLPNDTSARGTVASSAVYDNFVTATVTAHGFVSGNQIMVESVSAADTNYAGSAAGPYTIIVTDADHFTYTTAFASPHAQVGSYRVRLGGSTAPKAYATATAHGFVTGDSITLSGVTPTAYNGMFTITTIDANNFTYNLPLISPEDVTKQGTATVQGIASVNTTTATATAVNHGFITNSSIQISGASPGAFNGTFTITVPDSNHFSYTLASAQGDATGSSITAVAASASGGLRDDIINWVRGADNFENENGDASSTDIRASIHGDVLHSRPAVINYSRFGGNNDVYVFYGANDGVFHAVKGGTATDSSDNSNLTPGQEAWGFVPSEFFSSLQRVRNNSPTISSTQKKPYFADGPIGVLTNDADGNIMLGDSGDTVNLYIGMRRGGRAIYALDVNTPSDPKLLWKIANTTAGFSELGQTWSEPKVVPRDTSLDCSFQGYKNPVLIFGAGYDPTVEDIDPASITSSTTTSITTGSGTFTRSMGRGIYVVDAITGALVVSIGGSNSAVAPNKVVSGMDYAISSDITVIKNLSGGCVNRAYVGDTGGNVWRLDFSGTFSSVSPASWVTVTQIAAIGGTSTNAARRKFQFAPDVVAQTGFDAVLIGTGDREHPFDSTVTNRMYMFKDRGNDFGPYTGTSTDILPSGSPDGTADYPIITESRMYDATNDCIQVTGGSCSGTTITAEVAALTAKDGWYVTLGSGEKNVGNVVALGGTVFFNTNQPSSAAGGGSCGSNLGFARSYQLSVADATAVNQLDTTNGALNAADRFKLLSGGGYLPSPVHVVVQFYVSADKQTVIDASSSSSTSPPAGYTTQTVEGIISGTDVETGGGITLSSRYRKYWYKEIDQ